MLRALTLGFGLLSGFLFPPDLSGSYARVKNSGKISKTPDRYFWSYPGIDHKRSSHSGFHALITLDSKGKVIYSQERAGENGNHSNVQVANNG